ncbi:MAG TPA: glycerophosphodiester phosphodiesterase family protein [Rhodanobacteraceae bacterium]
MQYIAHRGGSGLRVENTLAAFANAIVLGAAGAELDVHLTRDGEVVVHHDDKLNPGYCRAADGQWIDKEHALTLADSTLAQLQAFDIGTPRPGSAYAHRYPRITPMPDQRIPRLADVIALVRAQSDTFCLVVEIKTPLLTAASRPWLDLVDATLAVIKQADFLDRAILCSFDWGSLVYARQCQPTLATWFTSSPLSWFNAGTPPAADIPPAADELAALRDAFAKGNAPWFGGFDPRRFGGSRPAAIAAAGGSAWFPYYRDLAPPRMAELARHRLQGAAWSVNLGDPAALAKLADAGADYVCADYPDMA